MENSAALGIFLDDLNALTGSLQTPILLLCGWNELLQNRKTILRRLEHLTNQVPRQVDVILACCQQRQEIVRSDGLGEVEEGSMFQELGGEACIRTKEQRFLAINHSRVEVRNRHRR